MSGKKHKSNKGGKPGNKSAKQRYSSTAKNSVASYINDRSNLEKDIKEKGYPLMGRMDFVGLSVSK